MKYLIVIAVMLVVFWLWRSGRDSAARQQPPRDRPAPNKAPPQLEMVRCQVCGVHLPEAEAVRADARYYCSVEHLNQDGHR